MKTSLVLAASIVLLTMGSASAKITNPVTDAQKAEFYKVCMSIAQDNSLCSCKADAAVKLIDTDFMAVVIASMKGAAPPDNLYTEYDNYIARSNKICKPTYM
ncbi:MAG TPA: hypothetical protein VG757_07670 [Devosia sp.]|nr:hypothetical protein [Devosia sp.]